MNGICNEQSTEHLSRGKSAGKKFIIAAVAVMLACAVMFLAAGCVKPEQTAPLAADSPTIVPEAPAETAVHAVDETPADSAAATHEIPDLAALSVGDTFLFGGYEQDNDPTNGAEAIEWTVLDKTEDSLLVISIYALDSVFYNSTFTDVTWETCNLRAWLNSTFLNSAFSNEELAMIPTVSVSADKNPERGTDPGNATTDRVFLLSINEALEYFSDDNARMCVPTAYAKANGAYASSDYKVDGEGTCWWWLRTPGDYQYDAAAVNCLGSIYYDGLGVFGDVNNIVDCVRPAMWITIG